MNTLPKKPERRLVIWPLAGIALGAVVVHNPFHPAPFSFSQGMVAWCVAMVVALTFALNPIGARAAVLITGSMMAIPCQVAAPPLLRALLMCFAAMPFMIALAPVLFPEINGFRARIYFLCTWGFTREVKRRASTFRFAALIQLIAATAIFGACFVAVERIPAIGVWLPVRWLAFGFVIMAFAEMATVCQRLITGWMGLTIPALMDSPYLSRSVNEFWTRRWNPAAAMLFRDYFYKPLARRGVTIAMFAAFFASGVAHALLVFMAIGEWGYALVNGAFFCVQPVFIVMERRMRIRLWRPAARRVWTIAVLTVTSPLFVAPAIQVVGRGWGNSGFAVSTNVLAPTLATLGYGILIVTFFAVAAWVSLPKDKPVTSVLEKADGALN